MISEENMATILLELNLSNNWVSKKKMWITLLKETKKKKRYVRISSYKMVTWTGYKRQKRIETVILVETLISQD